MAGMRLKQQKKNAFTKEAAAISGNPQHPGGWAARFAAFRGDELGTVRRLTLELAAGKADFAIALAEANPQENFLAIDAKPQRLWYGACTAAAKGLKNLLFLHEQISLLDQIFAPGEIIEIWITFPDPYPKLRHARRRLTSPSFIEMYSRLLPQGSSVNLKTDSDELFAYTLETLSQAQLTPELLSYDLHGETSRSELDKARSLTDYERRFVAEGLPIKYLRWHY